MDSSGLMSAERAPRRVLVRIARFVSGRALGVPLGRPWSESGFSAQRRRRDWQ